MSLKDGKSKEVIHENIREMINAGHPPKQAVAATYNNAGLSKAEITEIMKNAPGHMLELKEPMTKADTVLVPPLTGTPPPTGDPAGTHHIKWAPGQQAEAVSFHSHNPNTGHVTVVHSNGNKTKLNHTSSQLLLAGKYRNP